MSLIGYISKILEVFSKMAFLDKETMQSPHSTKIYKPALDWTLDL